VIFFESTMTWDEFFHFLGDKITLIGYDLTKRNGKEVGPKPLVTAVAKRQHEMVVFTAPKVLDFFAPCDLHSGSQAVFVHAVPRPGSSAKECLLVVKVWRQALSEARVQKMFGPLALPPPPAAV
jgi:hypothetical protein